MLHLDKNNIPELKKFAITMSWAFPVVFSLLLPWLFGFPWQLWPLVISTVLLALYVLKPTLLYYPYRFWMTVGGVLGWINTRIILGVSFYLLIAPIGMVMRAFGKLQYRHGYKSKKSKNSASSYVKPDAKSNKHSLENPF